LGHCDQILYKSIVPFIRFLIFTKRCQITCYTRARRLRHEQRLCADKQIDKMLSIDDKISIKGLRVEKRIWY